MMVKSGLDFHWKNVIFLNEFVILEKKLPLYEARMNNFPHFLMPKVTPFWPRKRFMNNTNIAFHPNVLLLDYSTLLPSGEAQCTVKKPKFILPIIQISFGNQAGPVEVGGQVGHLPTQ